MFFLSSSKLFAKPVDVEQSRKATATMVKAETKRAEQLQVRLMQKGEKQTPQEQYTLAETKEIRGNNGELLAYVTELEPEGFIITSADDTISPVLGYSFKGKFPFKDSKQNVLLHLVQWDVQARKKAMEPDSKETKTLAQTNGELWNKYSIAESGLLGTLSDATQWPDKYRCEDCGYRTSSWISSWICPQCGGFYLGTEEGWIVTNWDQGTHWNDKCPQITSGSTTRCAVGCVATAMGQIINYWKYPSSLEFSSGDAYTSQGSIGKNPDGTDRIVSINIDGDSALRGFPTFAQLNTSLATINYNSNQTEEAFLCFAAGVKLRMNYGSQSGADTSYAAVALTDSFTYGSAKRDYKTDAWTRRKPQVIENIKKGRPVQLGIAVNTINGHSVVADGYRSDDFFHINTGWGDTSTDTWYNLPNIDTTQHGGSYNFNVVRKVVYDICPYQGWSQWGADERNSKGIPYTYPSTLPDLKWSVTPPSGYSGYKFEYLVVGTGNKIYASLSPSDMGGSQHPAICVIDQYGTLQSVTEVASSNTSIDYLAQSKKGEIFFGASQAWSSCSLYRFNLETKSITSIYTRPLGGYIEEPIKVDSSDYIYFFIRPDNVSEGPEFVCVDRIGTQKWKKTFATSIGVTRSTPAIDESRNQVYLNYYDSSTQKSYLRCYDRNTGTEKWTHEFPGTHTEVGMAGTPAIAADGTIYIGCYTMLYALNPTDHSVKWTSGSTFSPAYTHTSPAIGQDGTLYVNYGRLISGNWRPGWIWAVNPSNGSLKWTSPIDIGLGSSDGMDEIYAAGNGVVGFTYSKGGTNCIGGIRDNGASGELLWKYESGYGGKMVFGPGQTMYTLPGNGIYALSVGETGDPDGLAMAYMNNNAPNLPHTPYPADGATDIDTSTLSWTCSDPDAHGLKYDLFVGESGYDMVPVATKLISASYQLTGLKPGTGYAWKIIATDGQAISESPTWVFTTKPPNPDLSGDGIVNFEDFAILASHWLETCSEPDYCEGADYYHDGQVDLNDLSYLCEHWLEGIAPPDMEWVSVNDPGVSGHESFVGQMSKYETTNAQYCQFLNAAKASGDITVDGNNVLGASGSNSGEDYAGELYYDGDGAGYTDNGATNGGAARINYSGGVFTVDSGFENHPVTYVSWYGATAFCNYYGYRLPTEWEWQAVADYDGSYNYGCGMDINNSIANYYNSNHPDGTTGVGDFGTYGYGMCDMAGNVWEMTSSCYYSDCAYDYHVIRGGCWDRFADICTVLLRGNGNVPGSASAGDGVGFRVCR